FADSTASVWITDQNSPSGRLRIPIDSCDGDNAIHEIAVNLIAHDAKSVIGGGIRLCENGGSREEHYGGKNSYHVRNGISLLVRVHSRLGVFVWKGNTVKPLLQIIRVAHASRVLAMTSRHRGLLGKDCFGVTPKPTRETRALPRTQSRYPRLTRAACSAARIFLRSNT